MTTIINLPLIYQNYLKGKAVEQKIIDMGGDPSVMYVKLIEISAQNIHAIKFLASIPGKDQSKFIGLLVSDLKSHVSYRSYVDESLVNKAIHYGLQEKDVTTALAASDATLKAIDDLDKAINSTSDARFANQADDMRVRTLEQRVNFLDKVDDQAIKMAFHYGLQDKDVAKALAASDVTLKEIDALDKAHELNGRGSVNKADFMRIEELRERAEFLDKVGEHTLKMAVHYGLQDKDVAKVLAASDVTLKSIEDLDKAIDAFYGQGTSSMVNQADHMRAYELKERAEFLDKVDDQAMIKAATYGFRDEDMTKALAASDVTLNSINALDKALDVLDGRSEPAINHADHMRAYELRERAELLDKAGDQAFKTAFHYGLQDKDVAKAIAASDKTLKEIDAADKAFDALSKQAKPVVNHADHMRAYELMQRVEFLDSVDNSAVQKSINYGSTDADVAKALAASETTLKEIDKLDKVLDETFGRSHYNQADRMRIETLEQRIQLLDIADDVKAQTAKRYGGQEKDVAKALAASDVTLQEIDALDKALNQLSSSANNPADFMRVQELTERVDFLRGVKYELAEKAIRNGLQDKDVSEALAASGRTLNEIDRLDRALDVIQDNQQKADLIRADVYREHVEFLTKYGTQVKNTAFNYGFQDKDVAKALAISDETLRLIEKWDEVQSDLSGPNSQTQSDHARIMELEHRAMFMDRVDDQAFKMAAHYGFQDKDVAKALAASDTTIKEINRLDMALDDLHGSKFGGINNADRMRDDEFKQRVDLLDKVDDQAFARAFATHKMSDIDRAFDKIAATVAEIASQAKLSTRQDVNRGVLEESYEQTKELVKLVDVLDNSSHSDVLNKLLATSGSSTVSSKGTSHAVIVDYDAISKAIDSIMKVDTSQGI